ITPTHRATCKSFANAQNGSRRWTGPVTACGGLQRGTCRRWPKAGSGWNTIRHAGHPHSHFGSRRAFPRLQTRQRTLKFAVEMNVMKHLSLLLIACAACTVQTATSPADEAAIKNVVARYVDARDHKDAKATEALFTADAD